MKLLYFAVASSVFCVFTGFSQEITRQSIGAYGGSSTIQNVLIEQSVGQSQTVQSDSESDGKFRPGFIQSRTFRVEETETTDLISGVVYPNPTNYSFRIELDEWVKSADLIITSADGNVIAQRKIRDSNEWFYDASSWKNGVYFITLQTNEGQVFKRRLIITK